MTTTDPPPLVQLLRQLSSDSAKGLISAEQKQLIKRSLVPVVSAGATDAGTGTGTGAGAGASAGAGDAKATATSAVAPTSAAGAGAGAGAGAAAGAAVTAAGASGAESAPLPLQPLLRQLSAAARDGAISESAKAYVKRLLLSGAAERVAIASKLIAAQRRAQSGAAVWTLTGTTLQRISADAALAGAPSAALDAPAAAAAASASAPACFGRTVSDDAGAVATAPSRAVAQTAASRDLLRVIFRALNATDLLRASGVCRSWCRLADALLFARARDFYVPPPIAVAKGVPPPYGDAQPLTAAEQKQRDSTRHEVRVGLLPFEIKTRYVWRDWTMLYRLVAESARLLALPPRYGWWAQENAPPHICLSVSARPAAVYAHSETVQRLWAGANALHRNSDAKAAKANASAVAGADATDPRATATLIVTYEPSPVTAYVAVPAVLGADPIAFLHRYPLHADTRSSLSSSSSSSSSSSFDVSCAARAVAMCWHSKLMATVYGAGVIALDTLQPPPLHALAAGAAKRAAGGATPSPAPLRRLRYCASLTVAQMQFIPNVDSAKARRSATLTLPAFRCSRCRERKTAQRWRFDCSTCAQQNEAKFFCLCEECFVSRDHECDHDFVAAEHETDAARAAAAADADRSGADFPAAEEAKVDPVLQPVVSAAANALLCVGMTNGEVWVYDALSGTPLHRLFAEPPKRYAGRSDAGDVALLGGVPAPAATQFLFDFGPRNSVVPDTRRVPVADAFAAPAPLTAALAGSRIGVRVQQPSSFARTRRRVETAASGAVSLAVDQSAPQFVLFNAVTGQIAKPFSPSKAHALHTLVWQRPPPTTAAPTISAAGTGAADCKMPAAAAAVGAKQSPSQPQPQPQRTVASEGCVISVHSDGSYFATSFGGKTTKLWSAMMDTGSAEYHAANTARLDGTHDSDSSLLALTDGTGRSGRVVDLTTTAPYAVVYDWNPHSRADSYGDARHSWRLTAFDRTKVVWRSSHALQITTWDMQPQFDIVARPDAYGYRYGGEPVLFGPISAHCHTLAMHFELDDCIRVFDFTYPRAAVSYFEHHKRDRSYDLFG